MARDEVVVVGAGRTGSRAAKLLQGKCKLAIIDRDYLDSRSLNECALFEKKDLNEMKAQALAKKAGARGIAANLDEENVGRLLRNARVVVDCTDNYATRITLNEYCRKERVPLVHTAALRDGANCATIMPGKPCFECWAPQPKASESCSAAGVSKKALDAVAKVAVLEVELLLSGRKPLLEAKLWVFEKGRKKTVKLFSRNDCATCGSGARRKISRRLCGSGEWFFENNRKMSLKNAAEKLGGKISGSLVRAKTNSVEIILLADGRTIVKTADERTARRINDYALSRLGL